MAAGNNMCGTEQGIYVGVFLAVLALSFLFIQLGSRVAPPHQVLQIERLDTIREVPTPNVTGPPLSIDRLSVPFHGALPRRAPFKMKSDLANTCQDLTSKCSQMYTFSSSTVQQQHGPPLLWAPPARHLWTVSLWVARTCKTCILFVCCRTHRPWRLGFFAGVSSAHWVSPDEIKCGRR